MVSRLLHRLVCRLVFWPSISGSVSATESNSASVIKSASVLLIVCSSFSNSVSVCRQQSWPVLKITCKPCNETVPQVQIHLLCRLLCKPPVLHQCHRLSLSLVSVSGIVLATAFYSVSYTVLAFTFASKASSFLKSDGLFKSVSVSQTFSTVRQRVRRCLSVHITKRVASCSNLSLLTLVHYVDRNLGVHIIHYHVKKKLLALMSASVPTSASSSALAFNSPCMMLSISATILC